jgi:hypothetical protein
MFDKKFPMHGRQTLRLLLLFFVLFLWGCHKETQPPKYSPSLQQELKKVVVMGFRAAMTQGPGPNLVQNPITGSSFLAEPVSENAVKEMNQLLFARLMKGKQWTLVSPGQCRGVVASIMDGDRKMERTPMEILRSMGKSFGADAVLTGSIYRWQQRVGSDYGVEKPASVSFDLVLVRPSNGAICWRGHFDKTQKSLFADLFDFDTYVKSSGRWLTAEKLADIGLEKLIREMPGLPKPKEEEKKETSADNSGN